MWFCHINEDLGLKSGENHAEFCLLQLYHNYACSSALLNLVLFRTLCGKFMVLQGGEGLDKLNAPVHSKEGQLLVR